MQRTLNVNACFIGTMKLAKDSLVLKKTTNHGRTGEKDPIAENRNHLTQLLINKSALKQDIAHESELVFQELKSCIKQELEALRVLVPDERVRLFYKERGDYEIHVYVGSDVLVFSLHQNVFRLPDNNPLWGTGYFQHDERHGYFGGYTCIIFLQNPSFKTDFLIQVI